MLNCSLSGKADATPSSRETISRTRPRVKGSLPARGATLIYEASNKIARMLLSESPTAGPDQSTGEPALQYFRKVQCAVAP